MSNSGLTCCKVDAGKQDPSASAHAYRSKAVAIPCYQLALRPTWSAEAMQL